MYYLAIFFFVCLIVLVGLIHMIINDIVSNPIKNIVRTIRDVEQGDIKQRIGACSKDEIGLIAGNINLILDKLEQERHLASIGKLSSVLAHEIKSPLGGIAGAIQVMEEETTSDDPKKGIIAEVLKEINRLNKMVKDFLQFSKPVPISPKMNNLNTLIMDTVKFLKYQYKDSNVSIKTDLDENISVLMIDADKIQQAFLNIFLNAIESMEKGGSMMISSSLSPLPGHNHYAKANYDGRKFIQVMISDTGHGISSEIMPDIFTSFFTTKKKGHGLGLPISLRIIEKHGGTIRVESQPDKGSKFIIMLPLGSRERQKDQAVKRNSGDKL